MINLPGFAKANMGGPHRSADEVAGMLAELKPHDRFLVATVDGTVAGMLRFVSGIGRKAHSAEIGMGVHDRWLRRGIGRQLLAAAIAMAENWFAIRRLQLDVSVDNEPAIALYRSMGFEVEGRLREQAFRDGRYVDALLMARLSAPHEARRGT
jgi:L-phenylalanine/L-methionine N-acetyltransferase